MFHTKSSSQSTFPFETSLNFNKNANDIDENTKSLHRLVQSSIDLKTADRYLSFNGENCPRKSRIESAITISDYSHSIKHPSRLIMNMNMNRTIDLIKRNGAGDENLSSQFNNKQVQTSIINDHYLTIEHIPIHNRRRIQLTTKQLILFSISIFLLVILLCLITIIFIF